MLKLKEKTKTLKALIILAIVFFLITLFINYFIFDEKLKAVIRYLFLLFSSFVVLYASFVFYKIREEIKAKDFNAFSFIFFGFFLNFIADFLWVFYLAIINIDPSETLTLADAFFISSYIFWFLGLFKLINAYSIFVNERKIIFSSFLTFLLSFVLFFVLTNPKGITDIIYLIYPTLDLTLITLLLYFYITFKTKTTCTFHYLIIGLGFYVLFIADMLYFIISSIFSESLITSDLAVITDFIYGTSYIIISVGFLLGIEFERKINEIIKEALKEKKKPE
jgi:hypothetical protein